jgi:N-acetylglucosaminyldiphosphoundecaprenol N-acetyl-beta-D-mannosaminyltransferase
MNTVNRRFRVLDVGISVLTMAEAVRRIERWVFQKECVYVNVCTTGTVLECHDDARLAEIVNGAGMATPDGMPLVWLGRAKGFEMERVYGPDLMVRVIEHGQSAGLRHFFYGATHQTLERLVERLTRRFPGLVVASAYAPPFRALNDDEITCIASTINEARPDVVWVGLGTPKQDFWVAQFRPLLEAPVLIAVGAAFDFHAGTVRQAPRWMMGIGLEWFFRLLMEPRRLWRRYLIGNARFVCLLLWRAVIPNSRRRV